jgi:iron complex transport system ATP-binding protein
MKWNLEATDVTLRIGSSALVTRVSLALGAAELTAIVGPNGAGKTSLLRMLAGEISPTHGSVAIGEKMIGEFDRLELALTRSHFGGDGATDIPFRASDVVALGRRPYRHHPGWSREGDAEATRAAMAAAGVDHLADRRFVTLSSGERALVSIARVLAQDTPIVLLDEPTAALDVRFAERVMRVFAAQARQGRVVVVAMHDLNAAARHVDRCVLMSSGAVVADGQPREVLTSRTLTDVYEHPMTVVSDPINGGPLIVVG